MLTFYHAPRSRSGRTMWLLEELGLPYDVRFVGIRYGDGSGARDPANIHPDGKVPAIVHDGRLVTESLAIALYLTDLHPDAGLGAGVGEPERGAYLAWLAWNTAELEPALFGRMFGAPEDARSAAAFEAVVRRIDTALASGPYLMGERFSAVDVMIGGALGWARSVWPASEALDAYLARITARPASLAAGAKDEPAAKQRAA